ncbi:MAG: broad specificity phosphatase PhoE [Bacteriovoracaceae bacterium]|jgi:broad specificity phosphatase PhoE
MEGSIILVKHAMPELDGSIPSKEWKLGERGVKQAQRFANFVRDNLDVDPVIYSSEETKAVETAKILAQTLSLTHKINPALAEFDRPALSIVSEEDHFDRNEPLFTNPDEPYLGKESASAALERFEKAISEIIKDPLEDERLVVTHGTVMSLFLNKYNEELDGFDVWKKLGCPSYAVVSVPDFKVLELNGQPLKG